MTTERAGDPAVLDLANRMVVAELADYGVDSFCAWVETPIRPAALALMIEVQPDGTPALKVKVSNESWSPPLPVNLRGEILYDRDRP